MSLEGFEKALKNLRILKAMHLSWAVCMPRKDPGKMWSLSPSVSRKEGWGRVVNFQSGEDTPQHITHTHTQKEMGDGRLIG